MNLKTKKTLFFLSIAVAIVLAVIIWTNSMTKKQQLPHQPDKDSTIATVDTSVVSQQIGTMDSALVETPPIQAVDSIIKPKDTKVSIPKTISKLKPEKKTDSIAENEILANLRRAREIAKKEEALRNGYETGNGSGPGSGIEMGTGSGQEQVTNRPGGKKRTVYDSGSSSKMSPIVGHALTGRKLSRGITSPDCHEAGKVVLEVKVLPSGKIIFMYVDPATNGSNCLIEAAKEIVKASSFNETSGPITESTMTFIFRLQ